MGKLGNLKNNLTGVDWWKHKGVNIGVGILATVGTAACIASVVCGAGLFVVGSAALYAGGLAAHMALSSEEERRQGAGKCMLGTAKAELKGIAFGTLFGRGMLGAVRKGGNLFYSRWVIKGGHARINSIVTGPRKGGLPLLWNRGGFLPQVVVAFKAAGAKPLRLCACRAPALK
ncbi:hypothetical protein OH786_21030 [Streptomyces atratus]|uniref:hypothetical protein n=1 Tax=Streptomyces atratus TaxID=1893 RepID=UPI00324B61FB